MSIYDFLIEINGFMSQYLKAVRQQSWDDLELCLELPLEDNMSQSVKIIFFIFFI